MKTKKSKSGYDKAVAMKATHDVLIESIIERLKSDEELDKNERIQLAEQLRKILEWNEKFYELESDLYQDRQFKNGWFTGLGGSLLGIALVDYGPKIVKLFKKK